jgi:hypothetical protein
LNNQLRLSRFFEKLLFFYKYRIILEGGPGTSAMTKTLRLQIILPVVATYLYVTGSAPFLGQWDSFDYLKQIYTHQLSALGIGRPVYLAYNIALWESARRIFHLNSLQIEMVVMAGTVMFGVLGVWLFQRLAGRILPSPASQMAAVGLVVAPVYAVYSGFIMTEVPMLVMLMAAAFILWKPADRHPIFSDIAGGVLFGLAVGIREQALTLAAAFLWILWGMRPTGALRLRSMLRFGCAAGAVIAAPVLICCLYDQAGFFARIRTWLHAIPLGSMQFLNNAEASLLYVFILCPGAWLAVAGAGVYRLFGKGRRETAGAIQTKAIPHPMWGFISCIALPIIFLWRDADVQMHPRYLLIALPASLIFCAALYSRCIQSRKSGIVWAVVQVLVFGMALALYAPFRQMQIQKMQVAATVRESVKDEGLIIGGNLSPVLDYYRGIGLRPGWQVLWSGWNWDPNVVEATIRKSWMNHVPVYLSTNAPSWSYFEDEFMDLFFMMKDCKKQQVAPNLFRVSPPGL